MGGYFCGTPHKVTRNSHHRSHKSKTDHHWHIVQQTAAESLHQNQPHSHQQQQCHSLYTDRQHALQITAVNQLPVHLIHLKNLKTKKIKIKKHKIINPSTELIISRSAECLILSSIKQEAKLSQRGRTMLHVNRNSAKSLEVIWNYTMEYT